MKIGYKKRHLNLHLLIGLLSLLWFSVRTLIKEEASWIDYGLIALAIAYLIAYFYKRKNKYLTIEDRILKMNRPFGSSIDLSEVKSINKTTEGFVLKTDSTACIIKTDIMDDSSLSILSSEMEKLRPYKR